MNAHADRLTWSTPTLRRSDVGSTAFGECGNEDGEFGEFSLQFKSPN